MSYKDNLMKKAVMSRMSRYLGMGVGWKGSGWVIGPVLKHLCP